MGYKCSHCSVFCITIASVAVLLTYVLKQALTYAFLSLLAMSKLFSVGGSSNLEAQRRFTGFCDNKQYNVRCWLGHDFHNNCHISYCHLEYHILRSLKIVPSQERAGAQKATAALEMQAFIWRWITCSYSSQLYSAPGISTTPSCCFFGFFEISKHDI